MNALILTVFLLPGADGPGDQAGKDREALQGTWTAQAVERNGRQAPAEALKKVKVVFKGDRMIINPDGDVLRSQRHGMARPLTHGLDD